LKALVIDKGKIAFIEKPVPQIAANEALVKVLVAGICNTDLEIERGYMGFSGTPGHEFVGVVEKCSQAGLIGQRIVGEINHGCGNCDRCKKDLSRHCPNRSVLGIVNKDGAFAEYLSLPIKNLHIVNKSISDEQSVFTEPLAAAFEIPEQVHIKPGMDVLVFGDGKLAQLIARVLKLNSAKVVVIGKHETKLKLLERFSIETKLLSEFKPRQSPITIEATGSIEGFELAVKCTQPRGTLVLKSTVADSEKFNLSPLVIDEIAVIGSRCGPFSPALGALEKGSVIVEDLISKTFRFEDAIAAFDYAKKPGVLKVLLDMR